MESGPVMGASGPGLCFLAFFAALSGGLGAALSSAMPGGGGGVGAVERAGLSPGGGGRLLGGALLAGGGDCGAGEGSGVEAGGRPVWAKAEPA
jgi:hypothetical protein